MAPRKRQRPNPAGASSNSLPLPTAPPGTTSPTPAPPVLDTTTRAVGELPKQKVEESSPAQQTVHKTRSWYGSWPRAPKASASTPQLARETILGGTQKPATNSTPELQRFDTRKQQSSDVSSIEPSLDPTASLPNIPEAVATLKEPDQTGQPEEDDKKESSTAVAQPIPAATSGGNTSNPTAIEPSTPPRPATSSGWLSWLGKSPLPGAPLPGVESLATEPESTEVHQEPATEPSQPAVAASPATDPEESTAPAPQPPSTPKAEAQVPPASSSWLPFWNTTSKQEPPKSSLPIQTEVTTAAMPTDKEPEDTPMPDAPSTPTKAAPKSPPPSAGSTWAFWSRDVRPSAANKPSSQQPQPEAGELAVIGQGSEAHPQPAEGIEIENTETTKEPDVKPTKPAKEPKAKLGLAAAIAGKKNSKRMRPQSMDLDESPVPSGAATPQPVASSKSSIAESVQETPSKASNSKQATAPETPTKTLPPNLLLPSFGSTYHMKDNPSIIKQIAQLLLRTQQPPTNHVFRTKETPKIKKAIAIGVHGLFPASYLRPIIGQPTGTSIRFANHCAEGIRRWADTHGCPDCEIEKVALEGEGKIANRVDNLWKLLLNWIEHLRSADLIILACHSQGVPVAVMLVAKLIDLGIITNARIGVCAMAGVSLGPFPDYKSSMGMLMGTGAELWEFSNPDSDVSKRYEVALKEVLEYGARITFVGSIDDQLVPMESAVYSPASHPYIYRAVFIDGRVHAPDFIAHLVGFALKLRNLGVSDHGLIRELSTPLAGSLYSGEGHSRLYYEDQVYDLAVAHALETTDLPPNASNRCCHINHPHRPVSTTAPAPGSQQAAGTTAGTGSVKGGTTAAAPLANPNPYHLPWIMRGLLEENFVKTELSAETEVLLKQFDDWKPVTKALKDVKYRLEAVRSRL